MSDRTLARAQADLVASLVGIGPDPAGFDTHRLAVARKALLNKRAGAVAARWPYLVADLGHGWRIAFDGWAGGRPTRGSLLDGWDFAEQLESEDRLHDLGRVELARRRALFDLTPSGPRRRRGLRRGRSGRVVVWCWGNRFVVRGTG